MPWRDDAVQSECAMGCAPQMRRRSCGSVWKQQLVVGNGAHERADAADVCTPQASHLSRGVPPVEWAPCQIFIIDTRARPR